MNDDARTVLAAYVDAAAQLTRMPLDADAVRDVTAVMTRIAGFAADVGALALGDDVEIAGPGTP